MSEEQKLIPKVETSGQLPGPQGYREAKSNEQGHAEAAQEKPLVLPELPALPPTPITSGTSGDIIAASNLARETKVREKQVEKILEADLAGIYTAMPPEKKLEFKAAGERTAKEINRLLSEAGVQMKKIVELIIAWLKIIPGVNRYFVEQEAKIKADELVKLNNLTKEKGGDK